MAVRTLVVGASGILAPLAAALVAEGDDVTGVARTRPAPDGARTILLDATSAAAVAEAIGTARWDRAAVYAPAVSPESLLTLTRALDGRVVLVRTSSAADPVHGEPAIPPDVLQLGWTTGPDGETRWHTPEEVSAAALQVLGDGLGRVLGRIRPWEERP